jgi:hypothetical protein
MKEEKKKEKGRGIIIRQTKRMGNEYKKNMRKRRRIRITILS